MLHRGYIQTSVVLLDIIPRQAAGVATADTHQCPLPAGVSGAQLAAYRHLVRDVRLVLAPIPKAPLPKAWSDLEAGFESFETDGDAFGLGVFVDGFSAVLATDSAHLVAAERNLGLIPI